MTECTCIRLGRAASSCVRCDGTGEYSPPVIETFREPLPSVAIVRGARDITRSLVRFRRPDAEYAGQALARAWKGDHESPVRQPLAFAEQWLGDREQAREACDAWVRGLQETASVIRYNEVYETYGRGWPSERMARRLEDEAARFAAACEEE